MSPFLSNRLRFLQPAYQPPLSDRSFPDKQPVAGRRWFPAITLFRYEPTHSGSPVGSSKASVLEPEIYSFLQPSQDLLLYCLKKHIPVFASCFGFQLAVMALGGRIVRQEHDFELGTIPISLSETAKDDPFTIRRTNFLVYPFIRRWHWNSRRSVPFWQTLQCAATRFGLAKRPSGASSFILKLIFSGSSNGWRHTKKNTPETKQISENMWRLFPKRRKRITCCANL